MRSLCILAVVVVVIAPPFARADAGRIVVPAFEGGKVDGTRAARVEQAIKDVLAKTFGDGVVLVPEKASCARDPACLKGLLEQHGADEAATFALESQGAAVIVSIEVRDAQGKVAARARQKLSSGGVEEELARLVVSALSPTRFTGRLVVDGTPPGGQVMVDDLPIRATDARDRTTLSVGVHRLAFVQPDSGDVTGREVMIPYGDQVVVTFPPPPQAQAAEDDGEPPIGGAGPAPAVRGGVPMWPAFVTGGLAGGGLIAAVAVITIELFTQQKSDDAVKVFQGAMAGTSSLPVGDDPNKDGWRGYGAPQSADFHAATTASAAAGLATFDLATTLSWATIAGGAAIAVVGGLGTGALVAAALLDAPDETGETGETDETGATE